MKLSWKVLANEDNLGSLFETTGVPVFAQSWEVSPQPPSPDSRFSFGKEARSASLTGKTSSTKDLKVTIEGQAQFVQTWGLALAAVPKPALLKIATVTEPVAQPNVFQPLNNSIRVSTFFNHDSQLLAEKPSTIIALQNLLSVKDMPDAKEVLPELARMQIASGSDLMAFQRPFIAQSPVALAESSTASPLVNLSLLGLVGEVAGQIADSPIAKGFEQAYVTLTQQANIYLSVVAEQASQVVSPVTDALGIHFLSAVPSAPLPEGPRTPEIVDPTLNTMVGGNHNDFFSHPIQEVSLYGSLSSSGDPSDPKPDANDIPGRAELVVDGLKIGANFQNGLYLGEYRQETSSTEGHHQFQTGMVDQSGMYANDLRITLVDGVAINPEKPGSSGLGSYISPDFSVETLGSYLQGGGNPHSNDTGMQTDQALIDSQITSNGGHVPPSPSSYFEMDPAFLGHFVDSPSTFTDGLDPAHSLPVPVSTGAALSEVFTFASTNTSSII